MEIMRQPLIMILSHPTITLLLQSQCQDPSVVTADIVFCGDDVCTWEVWEGWSEEWEVACGSWIHGEAEGVGWADEVLER